MNRNWYLERDHNGNRYHGLCVKVNNTMYLQLYVIERHDQDGTVVKLASYKYGTPGKWFDAHQVKQFSSLEFAQEWCHTFIASYLKSHSD